MLFGQLYSDRREGYNCPKGMLYPNYESFDRLIPTVHVLGSILNYQCGEGKSRKWNYSIAHSLP